MTGGASRMPLQSEGTMQPVLGVERSVTGRRWWDRGACDQQAERTALAISQRHDLPDLAARVLAARGMGLDEVGRFLAPTLRDDLPDPSVLRDMDRGVERLAEAVMSGETIGILADYDVDGATSSAVLIRFLNAIGGQTLLHVPDRATEGYGPSTMALAGLRERGASLVVTLDCGTMAFDVLDQAAEGGLDIIVVDHHMAEPVLPRAVAVINPNRLDEDRALGDLAAVGVTFLVVVGLNRALRQAGWYRDYPEPNLLDWLDLVALGTVCDVVPLRGLNRTFVSQGLRVLGRRRNVGLRALARVAGLSRRPGAFDLGYVLGPRINAAGRMGESVLGSRLLALEDVEEAERIAGVLDRQNRERKEIETAVMEAACAQVEALGDHCPVLVAAGKDWHQGVIGIVAGRLRERYHRPACVVSIVDGTGKGSGRSVRGFDLGSAIIAARQGGLLVSGGGHAMAAGFSLQAGKIAALREFLTERLADQRGGKPLVPELAIDGLLAPAGARVAIVDAVGRLGPFGSGHPEPRFAITGSRIQRADVVGQGHVRCVVSGEDGSKLKAIAFRAMDSGLGPALLRHSGRAFHLAGHLRRDTWMGRNDVQLSLDDVAEMSTA